MPAPRRRLRVGVPPQTAGLLPHSGHGRVWSNVLRELSEHADVVARQPGRRRFGSRGVDVWVVDGHDEGCDTAEPQVALVHEAGWFEPDTMRTVAPTFLEAIAAKTAQAVERSARVITASHHTRAQITGLYGIAPERVHVVHHGVDLSTYRPDTTGGAERVAEAVGRPTPYVLFAAALHPRKNLDALRQAMALLAHQGFDHALVVVGHAPMDRPDSRELEERAAAPLEGAANPVVRLHDLTDAEVASLMAGCAAFCLPSLSEGFGLTALEAMACGAPVVVSDRGALPEVVGSAGVAVPPDAESLSRGLAEVLSDPDASQRMRASGLGRAREHTWAATARGWLAALEAAVAR
jgi:glycosyltransferase involved in cell wall biosynthesis